MKTKILKKYVDHMLGFPVVFDEVFAVDMCGDFVPLIDYKLLNVKVLGLLADRPGRLTGAEIRFIRKFFDMTLTAFGEQFGVQHTAVMKWEDEAATMNWNTEVILRLVAFQGAGKGSIDSLFSRLREPRMGHATEITVCNAEINRHVRRLLDTAKDADAINMIEKRFATQWTAGHASEQTVTHALTSTTRENVPANMFKNFKPVGGTNALGNAA